MIKRKLVVLDLDSTLVYVLTSDPIDHDREMPSRYYDFHFVSGHTHFFGWKRPGLDDFLRWCAEHVDIGVWTAGTALYAHHVIASIFPLGVRPLFVYTNIQCTVKWMKQGLDFRQCIVKKLQKVWGRSSRPKFGYSKEHVLIVDDTPSTYSLNRGNAIPILPWYGDDSDEELIHVQDVITRLLPVPNVRQVPDKM